MGMVRLHSHITQAVITWCDLLGKQAHLLGLKGSHPGVDWIFKWLDTLDLVFEKEEKSGVTSSPILGQNIVIHQGSMFPICPPSCEHCLTSVVFQSPRSLEATLSSVGEMG